jgi:hypothetical protein
MPGHLLYPQPPELQLLGALCRPSALPGAASDQTPDVDDLCRRVDDWQYFLKLVEHHRVASLASRGAAALTALLPEDVLQTLRKRSAANAREAFRYLAELQRLLALLAGAGIRATVLKGVPLSYIAFGDVGLREVGDIDLLIGSADAERADAVLGQAGIVRKEPAARLTPKRRRAYARFFKDYTYEPSRGFEVDLHWRLFRDAHAAKKILPSEPSVDTGSRQSLRIGSMELEVLTFAPCLLYLAVHGAMEGWAKWKSLADIAALWARASEAERASAWQLAGANSLAPYLRAALLLAGEWLGPLPGEEFWATASHENALLRYITGYTRRQMSQHRFMPPSSGGATFAMKRHEARLNPLFRSRIELAGRVLFRPRMWETIDLPDALFLLYPLLSPAEWLLFRLKRFSSRGEKTS